MNNTFQHNRRSFLNTCVGNLGALAFTHLLSSEYTQAESANPLALKQPHFAPKAKAVICLFQHGGPSQVDLFDPKPALNQYAGQKYEGDLEVHFHEKAGNVLGTPFTFQPYGQCGMELSNIIPHTASIADEITLIRSMKTESVDHEAALRIFHTGKNDPFRPVLGAWSLYALGTENQNLPAYVVLSDPDGLPIDGTRNWSSGWLPSVYQGTQIRDPQYPVYNLFTPDSIPASARANQLAFLHELNNIHLQTHPHNTELQARISNYELAAQMQTSIPEVMDINSEPEHIKQLYGLDKDETKEYGTRCLVARRLVERGVRFVQIYLSGQPWDTHDRNAELHRSLCGRIDQPSAALVKDLKQRGLLDETIVLWTGEFGRLPISQDKDGRDHNRHAFSLWIAGGGFKKGYVHGKTDDFGYSAVEDIVTVQDLHATLLHSLGLDHKKLTYLYAGRNETLTDPLVTNAKVNHSLLSA